MKITQETTNFFINSSISRFQQAHETGHDRFLKAYERLKKSYSWTGMTMIIRRVIQQCEKCKLNQPKKYLEPTESFCTELQVPFTHVGLDIIGSLPITERQNQYIIVLVDYFTKWVEASPLKTIISEDVVQFLMDVFARHGAPEVITTDNGVQFTSDLTKLFLDLYDVYIKFVTPRIKRLDGEPKQRNC